jgi:hypothetical protein
MSIKGNFIMFDFFGSGRRATYVDDEEDQVVENNGDLA